jgi:hypothetical protein
VEHLLQSDFLKIVLTIQGLIETSVNLQDLVLSRRLSVIQFSWAITLQHSEEEDRDDLRNIGFSLHSSTI